MDYWIGLQGSGSDYENVTQNNEKWNKLKLKWDQTKETDQSKRYI